VGAVVAVGTTGSGLIPLPPLPPPQPDINNKIKRDRTKPIHVNFILFFTGNFLSKNEVYEYNILYHLIEKKCYFLKINIVQ